MEFFIMQFKYLGSIQPSAVPAGLLWSGEDREGLVRSTAPQGRAGEGGGREARVHPRGLHRPRPPLRGHDVPGLLDPVDLGEPEDDGVLRQSSAAGDRGLGQPRGHGDTELPVGADLGRVGDRVPGLLAPRELHRDAEEDADGTDLRQYSGRSHQRGPGYSGGTKYRWAPSYC